MFVCVKILLQEACRTKYGWDIPLPEYLNIAWKKWLTDLEKVGCIVIPRCIYYGISDKIVVCNLHSFEAVSSKAFCTTVYIVLEILTTRFVRLTICMQRSRNVDNAELPHPTVGEKSRQKNINLFLRAYLGNHAS